MTNEEAIKWLKDYIQNTPFQMEQYERAFEMAIKALSQEPCDDAISRDAVIEILENYGCTNREGLIFKDIRALPSVTQKSEKWIPFSERLPKPFEHCLITTIDGEVIYHYDDGHYSKYKAWMPLPKPYEPQESEDKE